MCVSVIIPTYNTGKYLSEAISSVLNQTYTDIELIVVDDGSTDATQEILDQINDPRLIKIKIKNSGVSVARNTGLDIARGEYIAYLDADDRWLPSKLEKQVALINAEPAVDFVFTNFVRFDAGTVYSSTLFDYVPELKISPKREGAIHNSYVITTDTFTVLASTGEMATWLQTVLIRSKAANNIRFPVGVKLCEDYHYMLRLYEKVKAAYIDESLVEVRRHGSNSYSDPEEMLEPKAEVISMVLEEIVSTEHKKVLRKRLGRAWLAVGYSKYCKGNIPASARAYFRAMKYQGSFWNALKHILALPFVPFMIKMHRR